MYHPPGMLAAKSITYSTGASGIIAAKLMERLGIAEQLKDKIKPEPRGGQSRNRREIQSHRRCSAVHLSDEIFQRKAPRRAQISVSQLSRPKKRMR
jgi:hypothetical protein